MVRFLARLLTPFAPPIHTIRHYDLLKLRRDLLAGATISVVEPDPGRRVAVFSLGPRPELSLLERGERLFYDARLSHDGWMSCHSCHTDGHSNGHLNDNLSVSSLAAQMPPSKIHLRPGWSMRLMDLVYAILLNSANDASVVIAEGLAGSVPDFAHKMNTKARLLGARGDG